MFYVDPDKKSNYDASSGDEEERVVIPRQKNSYSPVP